MKNGTILFCASKQNWPKYIIYNGGREYSLEIYINCEGEYEMYPARYSARELSDEERYVPVGNVDLKNVILDAIQSAIAGESAQEKELHRVKKALAYMLFAYENKDSDCQYKLEKEAVKEAQEILGPWNECMQKYFGNGGTKNDA